MKHLIRIPNTERAENKYLLNYVPQIFWYSMLLFAMQFEFNFSFLSFRISSLWFLKAFGTAMFSVGYTVSVSCVFVPISLRVSSAFWLNVLRRLYCLIWSCSLHFEPQLTRRKLCIPSRHAFTNLLFARADHISNGILWVNDFHCGFLANEKRDSVW